MNDADELRRLEERASHLFRAGRMIEAIEAHERLLAADPDRPADWYNLGYLQRHARRYDAALDSYRRALDLGVNGPEEAHLNRGVIFADHLGRPDAAEAELRAALTLNPRYVPALLNLGNLHEDRGERAKAREVYGAALAIEPDNALALARLAGVSDISGSGDPLVGRLRTAMSRPGASVADRADLGFALGHALDAAGAWDEAFAAFAAANAAGRAAGGARYDPAAREDYVDRLIRAFPTPAEPDPQGAGKAPFFICGMFRSGSTLTEQILASHSAVTASGELDLIPALVRSARAYPESMAQAGAAAIGKLREAYLTGLRALHPGSGLVTDKRPDNFLHIGFIKTLFPDAKIIHTLRNPLDNCLSVWFLHLSPEMPYAFDLKDTAHWYRQHRRLMAHWKTIYPEDIHDLDYDSLVADPRPVIEGLLAFCGLPWDESCLHFHRATNIVKTASAWQVREPFYRRASGRWRNYERHIGNLRAGLEDV